jgi:hypothetical protein
MPPAAIHLCIVQPLGNPSALGFLDQARYFRYQFRRLGAPVTLAKNRLRHDAINFIFGAHLWFDPTLMQRYCCIFVNLEQLGDGGLKLPSPDYLQLLSRSPVVDYDARNVEHYRPDGEGVPLISFAYAPYLRDVAPLKLEERPIDLLFYGAINERRQRLFAEIEAAGHTVSTFAGHLYGDERDLHIRQAKAVFNCHYYDLARFEQARVFQSLSLGTPVISERTVDTDPPKAFADSVFWVSAQNIREFFTRQFKTPAFFHDARGMLATFKQQDVVDQYVAVLELAEEEFRLHGAQRPATPWRPTQLHIGSGKDYRPGWLNIDILAQAQPDVVLDLARQIEWPLRINSELVGEVELLPASLQLIYANNVLEHVGDLPRLMTNCLELLKDGGEMLIEVPYEHAPTAWQDPTHVRAMNENSWIYYTDWFWYLGWFAARFAVVGLGYLDANLAECSRESAHFMRVRLQKVQTSLIERTTARTMRADFGGIPEDMDDRQV